MCTGSSSLNRNTGQHVLLKNNEKVMHCKPAGTRKRNASTEILDTEQYARHSQQGLYSSSLDQNIKIKIHEHYIRAD